MRLILLITALVICAAVLSGCTHHAGEARIISPKRYPQKIKEGIAGKKSPAAEHENITYKQMLDEVQVVHEQQQDKLK